MSSFKQNIREKNPFIVNGYEISEYANQDRKMEQEQLTQEFDNYTLPPTVQTSFVNTCNVSMITEEGDESSDELEAQHNVTKKNKIFRKRR